MFDPRTHFSNPYDPQVHCYLNSRAEKFIDDVRISSQNDIGDSNTSREKIVAFQPDNHQESMESEDSGVCSPPLWKNNPSPPKSPSEPLLENHNRRSLSPNSRTQAIVRGRWELMEMVKNMPESSYELTLKDLVQNPTTDQTETTSPKYERSSRNLQNRGGVKVMRQESCKKREKNNMMRSGSLDNKGLFLNMVFPFNLKSKKKKAFASNNSGKVSPKPEIVKVVAENDWWKKRFTSSSDSDSSRMSKNSGSSGVSSGGRSNRDTRTRNGCCLPCFNSKKTKKVEIRGMKT